MSERPILFSGPMVRAILEGRKTQTRRVLRVPDHPAVLRWSVDSEHRAVAIAHSEQVLDQYITTFPHGRVPCRYGVPGDRLWVRETWADVRKLGLDRDLFPVGAAWKADHDADALRIAKEYGARWRPSIHMPRWASRLTLLVEAVRVERLQDISEADAKAEGVQWPDCDDFEPVYLGSLCMYSGPARVAFKRLWDSINAKTHPWDSNPWVWVITFRRVES